MSEKYRTIGMSDETRTALAFVCKSIQDAQTLADAKQIVQKCIASNKLPIDKIKQVPKQPSQVLLDTVHTVLGRDMTSEEAVGLIKEQCVSPHITGGRLAAEYRRALLREVHELKLMSQLRMTKVEDYVRFSKAQLGMTPIETM